MRENTSRDARWVAKPKSRAAVHAAVKGEGRLVLEAHPYFHVWVDWVGGWSVVFSCALYIHIHAHKNISSYTYNRCIYVYMYTHTHKHTQTHTHLFMRMLVSWWRVKPLALFFVFSGSPGRTGCGYTCDTKNGVARLRLFPGAARLPILIMWMWMWMWSSCERVVGRWLSWSRSCECAVGRWFSWSRSCECVIGQWLSWTSYT
jgi:hypothetical protein